MASKKNKESKFAYNPAYAEGYAMLQSLRNNALRTGSYAPTGGTAYVPEEPERISLGYTDENIQRQIDAEKPWYQKFGEAAWDHVTEFPKAVWDTVTHPLSMWNSWFNR